MQTLDAQPSPRDFTREGLEHGSVLVSRESGQNYTVSQRLGKGHIGSVWLCTTPAGKKCAVKIMLSQAGMAREVAIHRRALEVLPRFNNVPLLHHESHGSFNGELFFIAMDFIDGVSLKKMVESARGRICEPAAKSILYDTALGLVALHDKGIAHCDVKADNVMVASDGKAFLCDFSTGLFAEDMQQPDLPRTGTPAYMAPEICNFHVRANYSTRVDVWSFGILAWEIALGQTPGEQQAMDDPIILMHNTVVNDPPVFPITEEGFSWSYANFVTKCLTKDPERRGSVRDVYGGVPQKSNREVVAELLNHPDNLFLIPEP